MGNWEPTFWDDPDFDNVGPDGMYFYMYLALNTRAGPSGLYFISENTMSRESKMGVEKVHTLCELLNKLDKVEVNYDRRFVWVYGLPGHRIKNQNIMCKALNEAREFGAEVYERWVEMNCDLMARYANFAASCGENHRTSVTVSKRFRNGFLSPCTPSLSDTLSFSSNDLEESIKSNRSIIAGGVPTQEVQKTKLRETRDDLPIKYAASEAMRDPGDADVAVARDVYTYYQDKCAEAGVTAPRWAGCGETLVRAVIWLRRHGDENPSATMTKVIDYASGPWSALGTKNKLFEFGLIFGGKDTTGQVLERMIAGATEMAKKGGASLMSAAEVRKTSGIDSKAITSHVERDSERKATSARLDY